MLEKDMCPHCDGTGTSDKSCCNLKELGTYSSWGANEEVKCCSCDGTGEKRLPSPKSPWM